MRAGPDPAIDIGMTDVLLRLLPLIICTAVLPTWTLLVLLLLQSDHGVARSVAFIAGITIMRVPLALIGGALVSEVPRFGSWQVASPIVRQVLMLAGLGLLVTAAYAALHGSDPEAPPPRWLTAIDKLSPGTAFAMGLLLVFTSLRMWLGVLLALATIGAAPLGTAEQLLAFVVFTLASEVLVLLPLVVRLVAPERSTMLLSDWTAQLTKHSHALMIGVSVVFGVFFLWHGWSMR